jgi:hypothetical protein
MMKSNNNSSIDSKGAKKEKKPISAGESQAVSSNSFSESKDL